MSLLLAAGIRLGILRLPTCSTGETCFDLQDEAICLADDVGLDNGGPILGTYPTLTSEEESALRDYISEIQRSRHFGPAPVPLRAIANKLMPALEESTKTSSHNYRAAEVFALGSVYTPEAMEAVARVILRDAPAQTRLHFGGAAGWYEGQMHGVRWLAAAAIANPQQIRFLSLLQSVILESDKQTAEYAASAYLQVGDEATRRNELEGILPPERAYLLTIDFQ